MRLSVTSVALLTVIFVAHGFAANVHKPPLGFITTDISPERWAQLNSGHRFKGKVADTIRFEQIQDTM